MHGPGRYLGPITPNSAQGIVIRKVILRESFRQKYFVYGVFLLTGSEGGHAVNVRDSAVDGHPIGAVPCLAIVAEDFTDIKIVGHFNIT